MGTNIFLMQCKEAKTGEKLCCAKMQMRCKNSKKFALHFQIEKKFEKKTGKVDW
jgi:hypothetical protein